jgi:4-amino-4-deoxychorismate lyase
MTIRIFCGDRQVDGVAGDDRGLSYGDGVFETILVHRGEPVWWREHWQRFAKGAGALGISMPDDSFVRRHVESLISAGDRQVVKLILTRGSGGRGYAPPMDAAPTLVMSRHDAPPSTPPEGIRVRWCDTRLAIQPALAGLKHCNRLEQVLARAEWQDADFFEGLMCDTEGRVVGATAANLFVFGNGRWKTPGLHRCGVAGVARGWLLANLEPVEVSDLMPADVEAADAVFLCNAVRGILPVRQLGQRQWPRHAVVEQIRRQLAQALPAFSNQEH